MSFNEVSKSIWLQMAGIPPNTDPYTADFYESSYMNGIDFKKLATYIKNQRRDTNLLFNWEDYARDASWVTPPRGFIPVPVPSTIPYAYKDATGKEVRTELEGLINKRKDTLDSSWGYVININGQTETATAELEIYYSDTKKFRSDVTETKDNANDFRINDKYIAISLTATNFTDFCYLINDLYASNAGSTFYLETMQQAIAKAFAKELNRTKIGSELKFVYEQIPEFAYPLIAPLIEYTLLEEHLGILKSYDDTGFFSWLYDSSGAVISLFRLMCVGNSSKLFKTLKDNPVLVKELYHNLDGESTVNGVTDKNYILFANLIDAVCSVNGYEGLERKGHTYYIGSGYELDSNLLMGNDQSKEKIFLRQFKTKYVDRDIQTETDEFGVTIVTDGPYTQRTPVDGGHNYHPLDLVYLVDNDSKDKTPYPVPAIFVKALSDKGEWADVAMAIRIGLDVLAIVIGIASLGTASPFLFALAVADITLSAADIVVAVMKDALMQTPEGRQFLAAWDKIMLVGGIVTAGPLLLRSTFMLGAKLFSKATIVTTKNFLRASLMKIILEINIANFTKGTVRIVEEVADVATTSRNFFRAVDIAELQRAGVVFLEGQLEGVQAGKQGLALMYNGEVLVSGEARYVRDAVSDISKLRGTKLASALDELFDMVHIERKALEHADVGEFALPANPKKSTAPGVMKGGGHGQSNIDKLKALARDYNVEHTYKNGVRIGNVKLHRNKMKQTGTGQSWFPAHWTEDMIEQAGKYVINNNLSAYRKAAEGVPVFDNFNGVRVGVMKTGGKPATIFPDAAKQPIPKSLKFENNPF